MHQLISINITKKYCKKAHERQKKEKEEKRQYGYKRYKNHSEDKKQKLLEYRKKYKMRKKALL